MRRRWPIIGTALVQCLLFAGPVNNTVLFIYLFAIHSTCTYEYIRVHKQIVQYGKLSENRQYIIYLYKLRNHRYKIEIMLKSNTINKKSVLVVATFQTSTFHHL